MEFFYREQRKRFDVLIDPEGRPEGGSWNYDDQNRESFGKKGPQDLPSTPTFLPDVVTREVMDMVEQRFTHHPGELESFYWPVTAESAQQALDDFIQHRLPNFGRYEDAMWQEEALLFHSRLSALLNVKLLDPRSCVDAAVAAYHSGKAPLHSVEGFVRQILGWREFIRGIYLQEMPGYADGNALQCTDRNVPTFFWDGETDMACVADCMQSVLKLAWSHHIPRLMVLGQFSLLLGGASLQISPMAHGDVCGCDRLGQSSQHPWHEPVWRRRNRRHQTLLRFRELYQQNEQLLPRLQIRL